MSTREHLEAAWRDSLHEPHDDETAHILFSIGRYLGPETMTKLIDQAIFSERDAEPVAKRLEQMADHPPARAEVETLQARVNELEAGIGEMVSIIDPEHGLTEPALVQSALDQDDCCELVKLRLALLSTGEHDGHTINEGPVTPTGESD